MVKLFLRVKNEELYPLILKNFYKFENTHKVETYAVKRKEVLF